MKKVRDHRLRRASVSERLRPMSFQVKLLLLQGSSESYEFGQWFGQVLGIVFVVGVIIILVKNSKKPK